MVDDKFKVITLCGSTRFKEEFLKAQELLTLKGYIVLTPGLFTHADGNSQTYTTETTKLLEKIHRAKIDMAEEVMVIDPEGYIGLNTKDEIVYATHAGKQISYYSEWDYS